MNSDQTMEVNEQQAPQEQPTRSETELLLERLFSPDGWVKKLLTPIAKVSFHSTLLSDAFRLFTRSVEVRDTFTLTELLTATELMANRRDVAGIPGDRIYLMQAPIANVRLRETLLRRSVPGICGLLQACDGAKLTLPDDMEAENFLQARYFLLPARDGERIAASGAVKMTCVGEVTEGYLQLTGKDGEVARVDLKSALSDSPLELTLSKQQEQWYTDGFRSVLAYHCCYVMPGSYYINLASDLSMTELLAGAIGMFDAMLHYRLRMPLVRHAGNGKLGLVVPRPQVSEGDTVYVFRPKCDQHTQPLFAEVVKLRQYLDAQAHLGKVKSALPLKKNALEMMQRLGGSRLSYQEEQPFPEDCFAVLAILPAGEDAPGTKVGRFQDK